MVYEKIKYEAIGKIIIIFEQAEVEILIETYRGVPIYLKDNAYKFTYNGVQNSWNTLIEAKTQIDFYMIPPVITPLIPPVELPSLEPLLVKDTIYYELNDSIIDGWSLKADSNLTYKMLVITGNNNVFKNSIFDGSYNPDISPMIEDQGRDNVIEYSTLRNSVQYMLQAYRAKNFKYQYNSITSGQEGIATGGTGQFAGPGLIYKNNISDMLGSGIKLRWVDGVKVLNNSIDVGWAKWTERGSSDQGGTGLYIAEGDGPVINEEIAENTIFNTRPNYKRDYGLILVGSNHKMKGNTFKDCAYGMQIRGDYNDLRGNAFINCRILADDVGTGNLYDKE